MILLAGILLVLPALGLPSAERHRSHLYAAPNLTIHGIAEGDQGFVWLATGDGLYRFDGVHFHRMPGVEQRDVRYVGSTADGAIWSGGPTGLWRYEVGRQRQIRQEPVVGWAVHRGLVYAGLQEKDQRTSLWRAGTGGVVERLPIVLGRGSFSIDGNGMLHNLCQDATMCSYDLNNPQLARRRPVRPGFEQVFVASDGGVFLGRPGMSVGDQDTELPYPAALSPAWSPGPLFGGPDGAVWRLGPSVAQHSARGRALLRIHPSSIVPNAGWASDESHAWVSHPAIGLRRMTVDFDWSSVTVVKFNEERPAQVTRDASGSLVVTTLGSLFRLEGNEFHQLPSESRRYSYLFPEPEGTFLASIRRRGLVRLSSSGAILEDISASIGLQDLARKIVRDRRGRIWLGTKGDPYLLTGPRGKHKLQPFPLPRAYNGDGGTLDMKLDRKGRLWAAYSKGLAYLNDNDEWTLLPLERPLPPVRSFAFGGNANGDDIWVCYRAAASFSRLRREGTVWKVRDYAEKDGYGPNGTRFLERDSRGWIWRGTDAGAFVLAGDADEPWRWLHLSKENGLCGQLLDDYGFFEDTDRSVWLSGEDGVTHVRPDIQWFSERRPAPLLTRLVADGVESFPAGVTGPLRAKESLTVDVGSAHISEFSDTPFVYRLARQDATPGPYLPTNGTLRFDSMPRGEYTLSVRNALGSDELILPLRLGAGPGWPWAAGGSLGAAVLLWWTRSRGDWDRISYHTGKLLFRFRRWLRHSRGRAESQDPYDYRGQVLQGRYAVGPLISRSELSNVYECIDVATEERVVIKILRTGASPDGRARERFAFEVAALQGVSHPGVVPVLDWWISPHGDPCLAMPYVEGCTLRRWMADKRENGGVPAAEVSLLLRQLGDALDAVHARGIVHRDLKPENVIVRDGAVPQAQLIDFGSAGFRGAASSLAATKSLEGSFPYLAPERLTGHFSAASDLYSLAVIALELLTGKRLVDLDTFYASPDFEGELEALLKAKLRYLARDGALQLRPCFEANPGLRPKRAGEWAREFTSLFDHLRDSS